MATAGKVTPCAYTCSLVPTSPLPPWRNQPGSAEGARITHEARQRLAARAIQEFVQRARLP